MQASASNLREEFVPIASVAAPSSSAVSWAAILAGAAATAVLSLVLLILGFGLGLSALSPWSERGADSSTLGISSLAWIAFTQIFASGLGGYLAGRLRVKWADAQGDEIYFRDTAHGLLSWAIASLAAATVLGSAATMALSGGLQAGATAVAGLSAGAGGAAAHMAKSGAAASDAGAGAGHPAAALTNAANPLEYFADTLFRADPNSSQVNSQTESSQSQPAASSPGGSSSQGGASQRASSQRKGTPAQAPVSRNVSAAGSARSAATEDRSAAAAEAAKIFAYDFSAGALSNDDRQYLGRLISRHTGLSQAEAEQRAAAVFNQLSSSVTKAEMSAKQAADKARKAAAHTSLWMFVALLAGAFCSSLSATMGGRQRDEI